MRVCAVAPRTPGLQGLHELDHLEVGHLDLAVLAGGQVGLGHQHTLCIKRCVVLVVVMVVGSVEMIEFVELTEFAIA